MNMIAVLLAAALLGEPWMKVADDASFKFEHQGEPAVEIPENAIQSRSDTEVVFDASDLDVGSPDQNLIVTLGEESVSHAVTFVEP